LDYAKGEDGNAIRFKDHSRSLILIQTTPDTNGYFVVLDQVKTDPGDNLNNHLHPASQNNIITTENLREYTAPIDHYPSAAAGKVTFYYISAPDAVKIEKSPSAVQDRYPGYPDHNRLTSIYSVDSEGEKSIATLIFPHNHLVSKPDFEKFSSNQFEGIKFSQGTFTDYLISTNNKLVEFDNSSFMGHYCWARGKDKVVSSFFVKSGTSFLNNDFGFESDSPLTIYVKGSKGVVISEGSTLKLKGSSFSGVKFDKNINVKRTSDGFIEVELPKGKFKFQ
jgi:hypothetical protein